jgi:hypothetical protein
LSLLDPHTFLTTTVSNTLSSCSSLKKRDHISHPYKTATKL